jgi:hypothetical protein
MSEIKYSALLFTTNVPFTVSPDAYTPLPKRRLLTKTLGDTKAWLARGTAKKNERDVRRRNPLRRDRYICRGSILIYQYHFQSAGFVFLNSIAYSLL